MVNSIVSDILTVERSAENVTRNAVDEGSGGVGAWAFAAMARNNTSSAFNRATTALRKYYR